MRACVLLLLIAGCAEAGTAKPTASAASPDEALSVPEFVRTAAPEPSAAADAPTTGATSAEAMPAQPSPTASSDGVAPSASAEDVAPSASGALDEAEEVAEASPRPKSDAPLPDVEVKNVGLHVGGGPNDKVTKAPIREAVKPHYDAMRACYSKAISPKKADTFGVDIRIPGEGGAAKISKPRTALKGDGLVECMVEAFEQVEFKKPPKGVPMTVSFSVEFRRKK